MFARLSAALAFAIALLVAGCSTPTESAPPPPPQTPATPQLRTGDALTINLQGVPDPGVHSVQVDEQGLISMPFIGPVQAAGSTTAELSQRIRETYVTKRIYTAVDVSVSVTERYVYVGGEVVRPGRVIWTPDLTAAKAIQAAGGFTPFGKQNAVTLVRERQAYTLDVRAAQRRPQEDPKLVPGDSLQVTRSPF
jgi:polysaccharide export outer membrane protein